MFEQYQQYVAEMASTWAESSVRSESQRLNRVMHLIDGDATKLWEGLQQHGAYSRATLWTRVVAFWDWLIERGDRQPPNPYAVFRKKNKRCFSNVYVRKPCEVSYEDALSRIETIEAEDIRNTCKVLLGAGLRWMEPFTLTQDGYVTGKGGKVRKVYLPDVSGPLAERRRYSAVLRELKKLGLRPHKLRSIKMTDMVEQGANPFELKKFAGWSSLSTAESYVNARDERIQELAERREVRTSSVVGKLLNWARSKAPVE